MVACRNSQLTNINRFTVMLIDNINIDNELIKRDLRHLWHPCSQMKDYELFKPLIIKKALGSEIELTNGKKIIDAISSWWCKSLGHSHPRLQQALIKQMESFEHVILANTTHEVIVQLSEKLVQLTETLNKVFYAGDGSCAVEIAMKMSLHARYLEGKHHKNKFIALKNAYHGETMGALSVSDMSLYSMPYESILLNTHFIEPMPYVADVNDSLWQNCETHWLKIQEQLAPYAHSATALLVEPIIQGAGGMLIYSQDLLKRLRAWTSAHEIHLIADEIMTGVGRTGKMLACQHANIEPDFLCLSKGLTSGWMAFSAVLTRDDIYDVFYDDYEKQKSFLHSHTYSGNALAASIANEVLTIMQEEKMCEKAFQLGEWMRDEMQAIANKTGRLKNMRQLGAIAAADLVIDDLKHQTRFGYQVYQEAVKLGALLRPLGNTIYWLPPLTTDKNTIEKLSEITKEAILNVV
jgi:adenosylmethionine-8-amino-7-oxononanoate aminotransferase